MSGNRAPGTDDLVGAQALSLRALLCGAPSYSITSATVTTSNDHTAARFDMDVVPEADAAHGLIWWSNQKDVPCEVQVSLPVSPGVDSPWTSLVIGRVDRISSDPIKGTMKVNGRDRTADLIDTKEFMAFPNQTSSSIVMQLGQAAGLKVVADATSIPVGRYYQENHDKITLGQFHKASTAWDLIVELAEYEDFDAYVAGDTLHFKKAVHTDGPTVQADFSLSFQKTTYGGLSANGWNIKFDHSLTVAKDVEVVVRSFNSASKFPVVAIASASGAHRASTSSAGLAAKVSATRYVINRAGLQPQQAQVLAEQIRKQITLFERVVTFTMPGELKLTPRSIVAVTGTGTSWDQFYFVNQIARTMSKKGGFTQTLVLKNVSPELSETAF